MRILKNKEITQELINTIAGEMLNIELSMLYFIDGKPIDKPLIGYPVIKHSGNIEDIIRAVEGYIYVSSEIDKERLIRGIEYALDDLSKLVVINEEPVIALSKYHSLVSCQHTNLKVLPDKLVNVKYTPSDDDNHGNRRINRRDWEYQKSNASKRVIVDNSVHKKARFIWHILDILNYDPTISTKTITRDLHRHKCSIFWDSDDITVYAHNDVVNLSNQSLRGHAQIVEEGKIKVFGYGNPLLYELSESFGITSPSFRNLNRELKALTYDQWEAICNTIYPNDIVIADAKCNHCNSKLWGSNYFLMDGDPAVNPILMCPLCMHSNEDNIEDLYSNIFRIEWNVSAIDMIKHTRTNDIRADIYHELLKAKNTVVQHGIKYTLIGDKYVAFDNINDYLYSSAVHTELKDKKIITIKVIGE